MSRAVPTPAQICAAAASGRRRGALGSAKAPVSCALRPIVAPSGIGALTDAEGRIQGVFARPDLLEQTRRFLA